MRSPTSLSPVSPQEMAMIAVREDQGATRRIVLETEEWLDREFKKEMG